MLNQFNPKHIDAHVLSVNRQSSHRFSKVRVNSITLLSGLGVEGDAHCGAKVKHRSHVARDPNKPNLRQVHLIHNELLAELESRGHVVNPGDLGENITTQGVALLSLPAGTELLIGQTAKVRLTGLRNPCSQIDKFQKGLLSMVLERAGDGRLVRKTGVMGVVVEGGEVYPGDPIQVRLPVLPHQTLEPV